MMILASEDPGCNWSGELGELIVETSLEVRADHADDCIEIDSDNVVCN